MRTRAVCEKCGNEFFLSEGRIFLGCQGCGGFDLKFDNTLIVQPVLPDDSRGDKVLVEVNSPFYGFHKDGPMWDVLEIILSDDGGVGEKPKDLNVTVQDKVGFGEVKESIPPSKKSLLKKMKRQEG